MNNIINSSEPMRIGKNIDETFNDIFVETSKDFLTYRESSPQDKSEKVGNFITRAFFNLNLRMSKMNFKAIDDCKGDITKFVGYKELDQSINILNSAYAIDRNAPQEIASLKFNQAMLENYSNEFKNAYAKKDPMKIMLFRSSVLSLLSGTSYIISVATNQTMDPMLNTSKVVFNPAVKTKVSSNAISKQLTHMQSLYKNGMFSRFMKSNEVYEGKIQQESIALSTVLAVPFAIVMGARLAIFYYYYFRTLISDSLALLANFVEVNSRYIDDSTEKGKNIREKQEKIIKDLREMSDKFRVNMDSCDKDVKKDAERDDEESRNSNGGEILI